MIEWLPIKSDYSYYEMDSDLDADTITFRLIWMSVHELIGFLGLFQVILQFFFLADMLMTWRNPLRYMQVKKKVVPIFLICSKIGQIIIFVTVKKEKKNKNTFERGFIDLAPVFDCVFHHRVCPQEASEVLEQNILLGIHEICAALIQLLWADHRAGPPVQQGPKPIV